MAGKKKRAVTIIEATSMELTPSQLVIKDAVPAVFESNATHIALVLTKRADDAQTVLTYAENLSIERADDAARAADVLKLVATDLKSTETTRKSFTDPVNQGVKALNNLFAVPTLKFEQASNILRKKLSGWQQLEQARLNKEAEEKRLAAEAEARRLAEASITLGDEAGAVQILEDLQSVDMAPEKAQVSGNYGASFSIAKRAVGTINDRLAFLEWLITAARFGSMAANEIVCDLNFNQTKLNALARSVLDKKSPALPGFTADLVDSERIR